MYKYQAFTTGLLTNFGNFSTIDNTATINKIKG